MRILITGGLGYLGGELVRNLVSDDDVSSIVIYDKGIYGVTHLAPLISPKIKIVIGDILDEKNITGLINDATCVVHLASLVGAPLVDRKPIEAYETNINGTKIISRNIKNNQRFIFASTGSCYGKLDNVCTEDAPISPLSSYGRQKAQGEEIALQSGAIALRFATVYGTSFRTRNDLYINSMVQKAIIDKSTVLYEGGARRTFIHVSDAARAVHFIIKAPNLNHNVYNIGDPLMSYSKRDICENISRLTNFTVVEHQYLKDPDQRDYEVSYERLSGLGFKCITKLSMVLPSMINYYKARFEAGYENG